MSKRSHRRLTLREPEQLEALVSPFRHRLLRTLTRLGAVRVRELADALERSPESLYYHLRALQDAGLVVDARGPDDTEARVAAAGDSFAMDDSRRDPAYLDAWRRSLLAMLRLAGRHLSTAVDVQIENGGKQHTSLRMTHVQVRLSKTDQRELQRRLDELRAFVDEHDEPNGRGEDVVLTLLTTPVE